MVETPSDSISEPTAEGTIRLPDGRRLGYAEYGPPTGDPLLLFHGTPGSRYTRITERAFLDSHDIRQITLERPGFGQSTYDPDREILDWPADVLDATEVLGIDQFDLLGGSGGAPFVLACAARIPDRLTSVGIVGGIGPIDAPCALEGMEFKNRLGLKLATLPLVLWPLLWLRIRKIRTDPEAFLDAWGDSGAEPDEQFLNQPDTRTVMRQSIQEAVRQGPKAPLHETRLHARPWGFDLTEVAVHVNLWHGEQDNFAPLSMAEHVAATLPSSTLHTYPEAGHFLLDRYTDEILSTLREGDGRS